MAHGTARAAATAVLGLVALQALSTAGGSGRVAELLADANSLVDRLLDPTVPAIPDRRAGETWGTTGAPTAPAAPGRATRPSSTDPRRAPTLGVPVPRF